jgi:hypothetical protein
VTFIQTLKGAAKRKKIGFDLVLVGISDVGIEIKPSEEMGGVLDK